MTDGRIYGSRILEELPCWNCSKLNLQKAFLTRPVVVVVVVVVMAIVILLHLTISFWQEMLNDLLFRMEIYLFFRHFTTLRNMYAIYK